MGDTCLDLQNKTNSFALQASSLLRVLMPCKRMWRIACASHTHPFQQSCIASLRSIFLVRCAQGMHPKRRQRLDSPLTTCVASCTTQKSKQNCLWKYFGTRLCT